MNIPEIVFLGDPEVGKTSITNMLRGIAFSFHYNATLAFDSIDLTITSNNGDKIQVRILDFSGQEIYADLRDSIDWNASVVILVVDATKHETLYNISSWLKKAKNKGIREKQIIICLNKVDMIDFITITLEDLSKAILSEKILPNLIISSAYTNVGHQKLLNTIIEIINLSK